VSRRHHDEEGSALVLAVVFVTAVATIISFLLGFAEVSARFTGVVRSTRAQLYAADGATEAAVSHAQATATCADYTTNQVNGVPVTVTCQDPNREAPPPPPVTDPPRAILTLRPDPTQGVHQRAASGPVSVRGAVFSQSQVANQSPSALAVEGAVAAVGACTGTITTTAPPLRCAGLPAGGAAPTEAADPAYPSALAAVPLHRTVPPCGPSWLVSLEPGYYDDAVALSALTSGAGACTGKVVWLKPGPGPGPGVFYFDFNFASPDQTTCGPTDSLCTWRVDDPTLNVVAGVPRGWDPTAATRPALPLPGGCHTDADGVQLVLGGQSRIDQRAGSVELCPPLNSTSAEIALYGLSQGSAASPTTTSLKPGTATDVTGFLAPDAARDVNEQPAALTATAALSAVTTTHATMTMNGFAPALPTGSRITAVNLRVVHREVPDLLTGGAPTLSAAVATGTAPFAAALPVADCAQPAPSYCDDRIDLRAQGIATPEQLAALRVRYDADFAAPLPALAAESLDGIVVEVTYTAPALEPLTGCTTQPYDPAASPPAGCAVLRAGGPFSVLAVRGTVYAPNAALDFSLSDVATPVVSRGIIAGSLDLQVTTASGYTGPVVQLPETKPRRALLTLRPGAGQGIRQAAGSGRLTVTGGVFSQSGVANASAAAMSVEGDVAAVGDCTGPVETSVPPLRCANQPGGAASPADAADPGYEPALETVPPRQTVPPCTSSSLVTLAPGYYDDAAALSALTTGAGACAGGKLVWLQPGAYYFDLGFAAGAANCTADPRPCTWSITDPHVTVVAGVPQGWDPATAAASGLPPGLKPPGTCRTDQGGVQLILGGQSRLDQQAGTVELCPPLTATSAEVAVYGLETGHTTAAPPTALAATTVNAVSGFTNPSDTFAANEQPTRRTADATLSLGSPTASLTLGGFSPAVQSGSRIDSASLRVVHQESGASSLAVGVTAGGTTTSFPVTACATYCEQRIDLAGAGLTAESLASMSATATASVAGGGPATESLDGIVVDVGYTPPAFEALSGCLTQPYDPSASPPAPGCAALASRGPGTTLAVRGTVYVPSGAVDVGLGGVATPVFGRGLISGTAVLAVQPAPCYSGPAVSLPGDAGAPGTDAVFTACIAGRPWVRARAQLPAGTVTSWSVLGGRTG
jgi:hypothetical protein